MICFDLQLLQQLYKPDVQGPLGGWVGILGFKCVQASAELQIIVLYHRVLRKQRTLPMMQSSTMPCATLEVVGCELRCASQHGLPADTASSPCSAFFDDNL